VTIFSLHIPASYSLLKLIDFQSGCRLKAGYYLLRVGPGPLPQGLEVHFERDEGQGQLCVPLGGEGAMLLRVRAPLNIAIHGLPPGFSGLPPLKYLKLPAAAAAVMKLIRHSRLRLRIVMPDGSGYVCVLWGVVGRGELERLNRYANVQRSLWVLGIDDRSVPFRELFDNPLQWLRPAEKLPQPPSAPKVAVVLHLYYTDLWAEFAAFLSQIQYPFDLWITHAGMDDASRAQISGLYPQARTIQVENRGRDMWPFISLLNDRAFEGYGCICKIHSKKSEHRNGEESLLGSRWRRRALYDLLGAGRVAQIVNMFGRDRALGIVGPRALRIPSARYTANKAWGTEKNRKLTVQVARRMGVRMGEGDIDFFAGSMCWARPEALEPLRRLNLQRGDFPSETGQLDGELQHAIERLLPLSALCAQMSISDVPPLINPKDPILGAEVDEA
jgi:Rhamnan synthesis protein F